MPVNVWHEEIDIKKFITLDHDIDTSTDAGVSKFEEIKNQVTAALQESMFYRSPEQLALLPRSAAERGPALVLANIIEWLEGAVTPKQYNQELQHLYNWADENRVWLGA
ncbi:hypothetical protein ACIOHC_36325 [Streptomyces sp. NPDC088252]|uniref:hypothetical protein n=1 Tax=Streptomyces sp. NPDC088252 TaxID=3365845 RepID=UPI0038302883